MNETLPLPLAVVHGETVTEIPSALYIPPAALRVHLETFEGPLDLLLFLVRKHRFDILDIPMTAVCKQYSLYVEEIVAADLELASDYLTMSALLIEIKTKMLLPRPPATEEEEEDPRADLVRRLLDYDRMRKAAQDLAELPRRERDFISPQVSVQFVAAPVKPVLQSSLLSAAYMAFLMRQKRVRPYIAALTIISVRETMSYILRRLVTGARIGFRALAQPAQGGVAFLALLQLALERMVRLQQDDDHAELFVERRSNGS